MYVAIVFGAVHCTLRINAVLYVHVGLHVGLHLGTVSRRLIESVSNYYDGIGDIKHVRMYVYWILVSVNE
jgi:hypothetical protein